jgi:uncharacterized protein YjiS (DUF1127 family)
MTATTRPLPSLAELFGRLREQLGLDARGIARRRRIAQITRELEAHADHELVGLGIARCDIGDIARRSAEQNARHG